ncbi:hypothetical protein RI129_000098 [Pyrocoelia pectoralis]|uniref:Uncharacterized protein n=1 Tax=Pyrocoelia pectoralis TaxID=417401 RepID=A0AAN7V5A5_9COLE
MDNNISTAKRCTKAKIMLYIKRARANVSVEIIEEYFRNLEESLRDVPPDNLVNYDETNFVDDPGNVKVLVRRSCKYPVRVRILANRQHLLCFLWLQMGPCSRLISFISPSICGKNGHKTALMVQDTTGQSLDGLTSVFLRIGFFSIILPYFRKMDGPKL